MGEPAAKNESEQRTIQTTTEETVKARHHEVTMIGQIDAVDFRDSGAIMVFIDAGTRAEEAMVNSPAESYFTPVFLARIPPSMAEKIDVSLLKKGTHVVADANLQGVYRKFEGHKILQLEVQITRLRELHAQGMGEETQIRFNNASIIGQVSSADMMEGGSGVLYIEAGTREAVPATGSYVESYFTPVFPIRIPARVMENIDPLLMVKGTYIAINGRLQGIRRTIEGKTFYHTELQATRIRAL